ncbi:unnamed protein product [Clonostachys byssicola]|uniref:Protein kinase domain-containing protein n=1 Tax=Clonostachys byssicola TaxID=160290 RepID=A0A9N9Y6M1_9HYPO|nr:unnamed protein product [Clonostachys byssicola]
MAVLPPITNDIYAEFRDLLRSPQVCRFNFEQQKFYHTANIESWLSRKQGGVRNVTTLAGQVYKFHKDSHAFAPSSDNILKNPILFSILVEMECGHMFDVFSRSITSSETLSSPILSGHYESIDAHLRTESIRLPKRYKAGGYSEVIRAFEQNRWAYVSLPLRYQGQATSYPRTILPFFYMEEINGGGTAVVYHCKIQVDLVGPELKKVLEPSMKNDPEHGAYLEFAVKSYFKGHEYVYREESNAFKGIMEQDDLTVVRYLGEYHTTNGDHLHHILLELGEKDLEEYMWERFPPVLYQEIFAFWANLFKVGFTLDGIHQLKRKDEGGNRQIFKGWHGDIKPDNILSVRGQFKLADFGFARFEQDGDKTELMGGTRTFGAPERDGSGSSADAGNMHSQSIDTWSLGCVFSVVATWVILGPTSYQTYGFIRQGAIKTLREHGRGLSHPPGPNCDDAFHDGSNVLRVVTDWHTHLRNSVRASDTISCQVLDLVDNEMLLSNPERRLSAAELKTRLKTILAKAESDYDTLVKDGKLAKESKRIQKALLKFDEAAPQSAQSLSQTEAKYLFTHPSAAGHSGRGLSAIHKSRTNRVQKSEALNRIVYGKTANREEVLNTNRLKIPNTPSSHATNGTSDKSYYADEKEKAVDWSPGNIQQSLSFQGPKQSSPSSMSIYSGKSTQVVRTAIDEEYDKLNEQWKRNPWNLFINKIPKDNFLQSFIMDRDIIFVVDNDPTMTPHWSDAKRTLLTLAMKIGPLDKDGLDLRYSCGNHGFLSNIKGYDIKSKFSASMDEVERRIHEGIRTDMCAALSKVFDEYIDGDGKKRQTLIILTNGKWEGSSNKRDVEDLIIKFIKRLEKIKDRMEDRWFSIQFVSFGDDENALKRLAFLDDELEARKDIVDAKPWNCQDVNELILGSITQGGDDKTPVTSPVSKSVSPNINTTPTREGRFTRIKNSLKRSEPF